MTSIKQIGPLTVISGLPEDSQYPFDMLTKGSELVINRELGISTVGDIWLSFDLSMLLYNSNIIECSGGNFDTKDRYYNLCSKYAPIGWSDAISEELAATVVGKSEEYSNMHDCYMHGFKDYGRRGNRILKFATESLASLLRANGIEGRVYLLKKID